LFIAASAPIEDQGHSVLLRQPVKVHPADLVDVGAFVVVVDVDPPAILASPTGRAEPDVAPDAGRSTLSPAADIPKLIGPAGEKSSRPPPLAIKLEDPECG
jgi:hypothetical protein